MRNNSCKHTVSDENRNKIIKMYKERLWNHLAVQLYRNVEEQA